MKNSTPLSILYITASICLVVGLWRLVSCTNGHYQPTSNQPIIDSLNAEFRAEKVVWVARIDSAHKAHLRAMEGVAKKQPLKVIYIKEVAAKKALPLTTKDSLIKVNLGVGVADSSRFTDTTANKIIGLGASHKLLQEYAKIDSVTINELMDAYFQLDTAATHCSQLLDNRQAAIHQHQVAVQDLQKQVKKQKGLKFLFGGLGLLLAVFLASL